MNSDDKQGRRRRALVTGANKGIGRAIAYQLGQHDHTVYLGARDREQGAIVEREFRDDDLDAHWIHLDVTDDDSVTAAAARITAESGELSVLVNNAGIGGSMLPPSSTPVDEVREVYETNVFGVIRVINAMLPLLRNATGARIVNVGSSLGSINAAAQNIDPTNMFPPGQFPTKLAYGTSKAALHAVSVTYANELRDEGILVNVASPGFVATDINGHNGILSTEVGARIPVLLATLPPGAPTAQFLGEDGTPHGQPLPW